MFTRRKKIGSTSGVMKSENLMLRLLRADTGFQASLTSSEKTDQEDGYMAYAQKEIRNAMLEAECKKAQAFMMQRYRDFY